MKILVAGSNGMLGTDAVKVLKSRGHEVISADLPEYDITDRIGIQQFIRNLKPDAVMLLAAYTAVDKAETERAQCFAVNTLGARNVACVCKACGIKLLYTSTDYVFPGEGDTPYETDSPVSPVNYYGKTKADGEEKVREYCPGSFTVRISWTYGSGGNNFVKKILAAAKDKESLSVVDDQIGSPTYTLDLARLLADMIESEKYGVYHASNEGFCSRAEFAREIISAAGLNTKIIPVKSDEFLTPAARPKNSRLSKRSLTDGGFELLPDWRDALRRYMNEN